MNKVENDETYYTEFNNVKYNEYNARDVFNLIVDGMWRNGEPGLLFYEKANNTSPYKYSNQELIAVNPCGEQFLPFNGVCNLGSLDLSKFIREDKIDLDLLEIATRLSVRFLDKVIDKNFFPTKDIENWAYKNRPIGIGIMGLADTFLDLNIAYGSKESIELTEFIINFIYKIAEDESIILGKELGIPDNCLVLPIPRRNITLLSIAPTGSIALIAGCSNSIEPIFSELTNRKDKTGEYFIEHPKSNLPHFRCAVTTNGSIEVTWKEHLDIQNAAQRFVDSGVSKTINFPNHTHRDTIYNALIYAWKSPYIKGITVYRNGSRKIEVLSPKNLKKDKCPLCDEELIHESGCVHCSKCEFSLCEIS
jgi:ribonucleoside-diphosphate reductase alpha chain